MMNRFLRKGVPALAVAWFVGSQYAQSAESLESSVEIDAEPMHSIRLTNAVVRVYDALIPGNAASLMHTHRYSGVGVDLTSAELRVEKISAEPTTITTTAGDMFQVNVTSAYAHRVVNLGEFAYRVVMAERLRATGLGASQLEGVRGYKRELEADVALAYRLTLQPGEATGEHTLRGQSLLISISGGQLEIVSDAKTRALKAVAPGDLEWNPETRAISIRNAGVTEYSAAVLQWK